VALLWAYSRTLTILRDAGMSDLIAVSRMTTTRNNQYKKPEKFAGDMLIYTRDAARDFKVVPTPEVADHCPLVLTLQPASLCLKYSKNDRINQAHPLRQILPRLKTSPQRRLFQSWQWHALHAKQLEPLGRRKPLFP